MYFLDLNGNWEMKKVQDKEWMEAKVPGSVFHDLIANGKIKDPYYRTHEYEAYKLSKYDYEYRKTFFMDEEGLNHDHKVLSKTSIIGF